MFTTRSVIFCFAEYIWIDMKNKLVHLITKDEDILHRMIRYRLSRHIFKILTNRKHGSKDVQRCIPQRISMDSNKLGV